MSMKHGLVPAYPYVMRWLYTPYEKYLMQMNAQCLLYLRAYSF